MNNPQPDKKVELSHKVGECYDPEDGYCGYCSRLPFDDGGPITPQPDYDLQFCPECNVMTNHLKGVCQKHQPDSSEVEELRKWAHIIQNADTPYDAQMFLQSLIREARREEVSTFAELDPTDITGQIDHFVKCKVCNEPSHHCQCDQAVYAINAMARTRLKALTATNSGGGGE